MRSAWTEALGSSGNSYGLHTRDLLIPPHCSTVCAHILIPEGKPEPPSHPAAPRAMMLLPAGAGDAGKSDTEKLVLAVSEPYPSARFTHQHAGKGFSLQTQLLTKHRIKTLTFSSA